MSESRSSRGRATPPSVLLKPSAIFRGSGASHRAAHDAVDGAAPAEASGSRRREGRPGAGSSAKWGSGVDGESLSSAQEFKEPPEAVDAQDYFASYPFSMLHCYECGKKFAREDVRSLQRHLRRKTAWTNEGLVGCRVNCLVNNKANNWQCGKVKAYDASTGTHDVIFYVGTLSSASSSRGDRVVPPPYHQTRALNMRDTAFYIIERGCEPEVADAQPSDAPRRPLGADGDCAAAPRAFAGPSLVGAAEAPEPAWDYADDITAEFCYSQSLLFELFGGSVQETGHRTQGHLCVTAEDKATAKRVGARLLYGEMLPRGVNRACGPRRLHAAECETFYDLGMGLGKVCIQVFVQFPHLKLVYGVELSRARYEAAAENARLLARMWPEAFAVCRDTPEAITVQRRLPNDGVFRSMQLRHGSLLSCTHASNADVVLLETEVPKESIPSLCGLLASLKPQCTVLSYMDLRRHWADEAGACPLRQKDYNVSNADRFETSWSVKRGHHFFIWERLTDRAAALLSAQERRAAAMVVREDGADAPASPAQAPAQAGAAAKAWAAPPEDRARFVTRLFDANWKSQADAGPVRLGAAHRLEMDLVPREGAQQSRHAGRHRPPAQGHAPPAAHHGAAPPAGCAPAAGCAAVDPLGESLVPVPLHAASEAVDAEQHDAPIDCNVCLAMLMRSSRPRPVQRRSKRTKQQLPPVRTPAAASAASAPAAAAQGAPPRAAGAP